MWKVIELFTTVADLLDIRLSKMSIDRARQIELERTELTARSL
jgi:hypothetical protein